MNVLSRKLVSAGVSSYMISNTSFRRFSSNKVPNLTLSLCQFAAGSDKTVNIDKAEEMINKAPRHSNLLVNSPSYFHSPRQSLTKYHFRSFLSAGTPLMPSPAFLSMPSLSLLSEVLSTKPSRPLLQCWSARRKREKYGSSEAQSQSETRTETYTTLV